MVREGEKKAPRKPISGGDGVRVRRRWVIGPAGLLATRESGAVCGTRKKDKTK